MHFFTLPLLTITGGFHVPGPVFSITHPFPHSALLQYSHLERKNATLGKKQGTKACTASEWPSWNLNPGSLIPQLKGLSNTLSRQLDLVSNLVFKVSVHSPRNQNQITGPPVGIRTVTQSGLRNRGHPPCTLHLPSPPLSPHRCP